jgi:glycosyltransferase involved in cell wall biosynthesis
MTILYFCNAINKAGGLDRIVIEKANYLSKKHNVYILTTKQPEKEYFYPLDSNVKHIDYSEFEGSNSIWFSKKKFKKIINKINPDIIIAPTGKESMVLPFFDKHIPKIKEMHFSREHRIIQASEKGIFKKIVLKLLDRLEVWVYKKYDAVTPLTYEDAKKWPLDNLQVIYNFKTITSTEQALLKNKAVISVGRLDYQKGYDLLLKAWNIVCKQNNDWILDIYGDGVLKEELIKQAKDLNIANRVIFHGNVKDIKEKYLNSSIYVLSSRHEGLPLVLPEAMECGLPVVSFACPCGPKDIIENNVDGILVDNGNVEKLAQEILKLIYSKETREKIGNNARNKAKNFTKEKIMSKWEKLFNKLINEQSFEVKK